MHVSTLPGVGPWTWLEPGLWVYRSRELDLLGQADGLLAGAVDVARAGGPGLRALKRRMHAAGIGASTAPAAVGGGGHRYVVQVALQFLAGYHDLALRDVVQVGHGRILCSDPDWMGRSEVTEVVRGALIGLAATEPATSSAGPAGGPATGSPAAGRPAIGAGDRAGSAGGTAGPAGSPAGIEAGTRAIPTSNGWQLHGRKRWVSRILEADAFVVFARSPEHLGAFYVPANTPGVGARPTSPTGWTGWSWGELSFEGVRVPASAGIGASLGGVAVFRRHFAEYRPLVAATCLGAAAACVDGWVEHALRRADGDQRLPDAVTEQLGDLRGKVLLALSGLLTGAARPGGVDSSWSRIVRAQAVGTAVEVVRSVWRGMSVDGLDADALDVQRVLSDLERFELGDAAGEPLLRSAGERFVRYSAAIMDEISEPTSTMPRPRLAE